MNVDERLEAEIDALLARDDTASVIDTLLSLPRGSAEQDADGSWEKILHARLQARLARRMREVLEDTQKRKDTRSAA